MYHENMFNTLNTEFFHCHRLNIGTTRFQYALGYYQFSWAVIRAFFVLNQKWKHKQEEHNAQKSNIKQTSIEQCQSPAEVI